MKIDAVPWLQQPIAINQHYLVQSTQNEAVLPIVVRDRIIKELSQNGYRYNALIELKSFDREPLQQAAQIDMFTSKKIVEIVVTANKLDNNWLNWLQSISPTNVILLIRINYNKNIMASTWFQWFAQNHTIIGCWSLTPKTTPAYIRYTLKCEGLNLNAEAMGTLLRKCDNSPVRIKQMTDLMVAVFLTNKKTQTDITANDLLDSGLFDKTENQDSPNSNTYTISQLLSCCNTNSDSNKITEIVSDLLITTEPMLLFMAIANEILRNNLHEISNVLSHYDYALKNSVWSAKQINYYITALALSLSLRKNIILLTPTMLTSLEARKDS